MLIALNQLFLHPLQPVSTFNFTQHAKKEKWNILIFWINFVQKVYFQSKIGQMYITMEHGKFQLV